MKNGDYKLDFGGVIIFSIIGLVSSIFGVSLLISWLINHVKII